MDRNDVHNQIATLSGKISHLNNLLSQESNLHPVEADLLLGYARELHGMVEQLATIKSDLKVIKKEERVEAVPDSVVEKIANPVSPVKMENAEIKQQQHILGRGEEAAPVERSIAIVNTEPEQPVMENVEIQSVEEIVMRKKTVATSFAGKEKSVSLNEKFRKETTALSDKLKDAKKKTIKELFDLNERYKFIEVLFGGSADQFNKTMSDLGKISSRDGAMHYIETLRVKYSWDKKQALAERFSGQVLAFLS